MNKLGALNITAGLLLLSTAAQAHTGYETTPFLEALHLVFGFEHGLSALITGLAVLGYVMIKKSTANLK